MLVHKSIDVRADIWKRLRLHAEISGVAVRDYLSYLIEQSKPVTDDNLQGRRELDQVVSTNSIAAKERGSRK